MAAVSFGWTVILSGLRGALDVPVTEAAKAAAELAAAELGSNTASGTRDLQVMCAAVTATAVVAVAVTGTATAVTIAAV